MKSTVQEVVEEAFYRKRSADELGDDTIIEESPPCKKQKIPAVNDALTPQKAPQPEHLIQLPCPAPQPTFTNPSTLLHLAS
jgi:hypothetical protein